MGTALNHRIARVQDQVQDKKLALPNQFIKQLDKLVFDAKIQTLESCNNNNSNKIQSLKRTLFNILQANKDLKPNIETL
jgi:hypothetical protein